MGHSTHSFYHSIEEFPFPYFRLGQAMFETRSKSIQAIGSHRIEAELGIVIQRKMLRGESKLGKQEGKPSQRPVNENGNQITDQGA